MHKDNQNAPQTRDDVTPPERARSVRPEPPASEDDEFHLTIKKLEAPVRPRGVLAE